MNEACWEVLEMQPRTYAFHLQWSEDPAGHEHPQWDGENEEERQCQ